MVEDEGVWLLLSFVLSDGYWQNLFLQNWKFRLWTLKKLAISQYLNFCFHRFLSYRTVYPFQIYKSTFHYRTDPHHTRSIYFCSHTLVYTRVHNNSLHNRCILVGLLNLRLRLKNVPRAVLQTTTKRNHMKTEETFCVCYEVKAAERRLSYHADVTLFTPFAQCGTSCCSHL